MRHQINSQRISPRRRNYTRGTREFFAARKKFPSVSFPKKIAEQARGKDSFLWNVAFNESQGREEEQKKNAECIKRVAAFVTLSRYSATGLIPDPRVSLCASTGCRSPFLQAMGVRRDGLHGNCIRRGNARNDDGASIAPSRLACARPWPSHSWRGWRQTGLRSAPPCRENVGKPNEN